jgi:hypothetical protein
MLGDRALIDPKHFCYFFERPAITEATSDFWRDNQIAHKPIIQDAFCLLRFDLLSCRRGSRIRVKVFEIHIKPAIQFQYRSQKAPSSAPWTFAHRS